MNKLESRKSIKDIVQEKFDKIEDKQIFKDKKNKKEFFDELEKENTDLKRSSIESTFSSVLKSHCKTNKIDFNEFSTKPQKRFSSSLDLETKGKPVEIQEENKGVQIQNPKAVKSDENNKPDHYPLESVAGSFNSFLKIFEPSLENLTKEEREDASACLNMAFGNVLENSAKARALFGAAGLFGLYSGKIGEARKERMKQKEITEKATQKVKELPSFEISEEEKNQFAQTQEEFLQNARKSYENKGVQL